MENRVSRKWSLWFALLFPWLHWGLAAQPGDLAPDPSLKLHLNFDTDFSDGRIADASGNGNDGWQPNPTNWIQAATGVFGSTAGLFSYAGLLSNDPPHVYAFSQYIAVTNVTGFEYLTNGTISFWARFGANGDLVMQIMDTGYPVGHSGNPNAALNSWTLGRTYSTYLVFTVHTAFGDMQVVSWPNDVVQWGGSRPDLSTTKFHLYTLTVDGSSRRAIAYYDGLPYYTNSLPTSWIRIYGCPSQRWLCIGAMSHDGTPNWGDDLYPNAGFFVGKMDDVRIYNRTLSAAEVQRLYTGSTYAQNLQIQPVDSQNIQLSWDTQTNTVYQVEYLPDLNSNSWISLKPPIAGNGAASSLKDSLTEQPSRFYRVRVLP